MMSERHWSAPVAPPASTAQARIELAAICRLVAREGLAPIGGARFAMRDPETALAFLVNPGALLLEQVRASDLLRVDRDGVRIDSGAPQPDAGGLALVLAALDAQPRSIAAAQLASSAGCVVAALDAGLLPITQTAFMFHGRIGRHDWDPRARGDDLRRRLAADLGENHALLIDRRGLLVCAGSAAQTWKLLFFLDKCCRAQVKAMAAAHAAGEVLTIPSSEVVAHACAQSQGFVAHPRFVADWSSFLDQLEREDPSFRE